MNSSDFMRLLSTDHYSPADLEEVRGLCRHYPMFNLAHILKVRIHEALGMDKKKELKLAAVYSCDRKRFYDLVREVSGEDQDQEEETSEETEGIQFTEDSQQQADMIIEQHASYATPETEPHLLELDEEEEKQQGPDEELSSETIVGAFMKDEEDMEEPEVEHPMETPAIDVVEKERESEREKLIKNFIMDEPGPIKPDRETALKGDVSLASISEHDGFITDTLAQIYVKQGLYAKAIYAYEKLSLKYPEKSTYFATQINRIKSKLKEN